jgi:hypothetical protein
MLFLFQLIVHFIEFYGVVKIISIRGRDLTIKRMFFKPLQISIDDIERVNLRTGYYVAYYQGRRVFRVTSMMLSAERLLRLLSEVDKVDADKDKHIIRLRRQSRGPLLLAIISGFIFWFFYMSLTISFDGYLILVMAISGCLLVVGIIFLIRNFSYRITVDHTYITTNSFFEKAKSYPLASVTVDFHDNIDFLVNGKRIVRLKDRPIGLESMIRRLSSSDADFFMYNVRILPDDLPEYVKLNRLNQDWII